MTPATLNKQAMAAGVLSPSIIRSDQQTLLIDASGHAPWLSPIVDRLNEIAQLPPGWNSYKSSSIKPESIKATMKVLSQSLPELAPAPHVVPTPKGYIQLEWHQFGWHVELEVFSDELYSLLIAAPTGEEEEVEGDLQTVLPMIQSFIRKLIAKYNPNRVLVVTAS